MQLAYGGGVVRVMWRVWCGVVWWCGVGSFVHLDKPVDRQTEGQTEHL